MFEFRSQAEAVSHQLVNPKMRIFSEEYTANGARRFHVAKVDKFWREYKDWDDKFCHEIIQEGMPCRMYFDLEFDKEWNTHVDGDRMLNSFIRLVNDHIDEEFDIRVNRKKWLLLDSSSDRKFSIHAVVRLPHNRLFPSNAELKRFVDRVASAMEVCRIGVVNSPKGRTLFLDRKVYSRNRQFRLFLSSKFGVDRPFELKDDCTYYRRIRRYPSAWNIFLDSLVVPVNYYNCPLLDV